MPWRPGRPQPTYFSRASRRRSSTASPGSRRWSGWASLRISPMRLRSSLGPMAPGSTARRCAPTAESSEADSSSTSQFTTHRTQFKRICVMKQVIVVTGASSGFGALAARALAHAGHTVCASMRETADRNAPAAAEVARYAAEHNVDLRTVELDVASDASTEAGIAKIIADNGRLDV